MLTRIKILTRYSSWKKIFNLVLTGIMVILRKTYIYNYPIVAYVEPTNICNLHCPGCPTGIGLPSNRKRSFLTFAQFKFFVDQIKDFIYSINFSNWGEPLLNPQILDMIRYAHRQHIRTCTNTNFNVKLSEDQAHMIVNSGLDHITIGLDGFSQEVYETYRKGGNIGLVIKNIEMLVRAKRILKSNTPVIELQFIIFSHNTSEIKFVKKFAKKVGAKFVCIYGRLPNKNFDPIPNEPYLPNYPACIFLWTIVTLNADTGLTPCCLVYYKNDDFDELRPGFNFKEFWNGEKFIYSRALFSRIKNIKVNAHKVLKKSGSPCLRCEYFTKKSERYGIMGIT
jgi:pyruvate-formate lyase-activating enzyme